MPEPIKPCFPYPGGKTRFLKHILPLIPPHQTYVEAFAGGLAVLLAKDRARSEVVNDKNGDIVTFYRYVKFHREALFGELRGYLNARRNFEDLKVTPGLTDLQRCVRWFLLSVCSWGNKRECWTVGGDHYVGFNFERHTALIEAVGQRLAGVAIEEGDWEKVVKRLDGPDTFFFFDPPYVEAQKTAYFPFSEFEMERFAARLRKLKGTWLVTVDDSAACRRIFAGLPAQRIPMRYSLSNPKRRERREITELLIIAPRLAAAGTARIAA